VTVVEFFDPACETCAAMHEPVKQLLASYPDQVRMVVRHAPFHVGSEGVAKMLEAARLQDKYLEVLEVMHPTQPRWASHVLRQRASPAELRVGAAAGVDRGRGRGELLTASRRARPVVLYPASLVPCAAGVDREAPGRRSRRQHRVVRPLHGVSAMSPRLPLVLSVLLGFGCPDPLDPDPTPGEPTPAEDSVVETVGADGATLSLSNGVEVVIPAGALTEDVDIGVAWVADVAEAGLQALPEGLAESGGEALALTPHGQTFAAPIQVRIPTTSVGSEAIVLRLADEDADEWLPDGPVTSDADGVTVEIVEFSLYTPAVIADACPCWTGAELETLVARGEAAGGTPKWRTVGTDQAMLEFVSGGAVVASLSVDGRYGYSTCSLEADDPVAYWPASTDTTYTPGPATACRGLLHARAARKEVGRNLGVYVTALPVSLTQSVEVDVEATPPGGTATSETLTLGIDRLAWMSEVFPDGTTWTASITAAVTDLTCVLPEASGTVSGANAVFEVLCAPDEVTCDGRDNDHDGEIDEDDGPDTDGDGLADACDDHPADACPTFDLDRLTSLASDPAASRHVDAPDTVLPAPLQGQGLVAFTGVLVEHQASPFAVTLSGVVELADGTTTLFNGCTDALEGAGACATLGHPAATVVFDASSTAADACTDLVIHLADTTAFAAVTTSSSRLTCALTDAGAIRCWGNNAFGQLDDIPTGTFTSLDAGGFHVCAIDPVGAIHCWGGLNTWGESTPPTGGPYMAVSAASYNSCALTDQGAVECWGLEDLYGTDLRPPAGVGPFESLSVAFDHACGLAADGTTTCWGGDRNGRSDPPSTPFIKIDTVEGSGCGLTAAGEIECWGGSRFEPPTGPFVDFALGLEHLCALAADGSVSCVGSNGWAQLEVPEAADFKAIEGNTYHTCGVTRLNDLWCWGDATDGQTTVP